MFDAALLESRGGWKGRGKGASLPLAIGLHLAIVGAFVGAAVWNTGEPPEPVIPVTFFAPAGAPPPPIGNGGPSRPQTRSTSNAHPTTVAQTEIPPDPVGPDHDLSPVEDGTTVPGGDEKNQAGSQDGIPGATNEGPGGGAGVDPGAAPVQVAGDVRAPILVWRVEPEYPEAMRRAHMEGVVILEAVITAAGDVTEVRILKSATPLLDRATVDAVRRWRYKPATLNGRAVSVYLTVTVSFGLRS
jgi:protein TonB